MTNRTRAGFTLVELLVVVAIIAVLAALLMPALGRSRNRGRATLTEQTVLALQNAFSVVEMEVGTIEQGTFSEIGFRDSRPSTRPGKPNENETNSSRIWLMGDWLLEAGFQPDGTQRLRPKDSSVQINSSVSFAQNAITILHDPWERPYVWITDNNLTNDDVFNWRTIANVENEWNQVRGVTFPVKIFGVGNQPDGVINGSASGGALHSKQIGASGISAAEAESRFKRFIYAGGKERDGQKLWSGSL